MGDLTLDVAGLPQGIMFLDGKIQGIAAAGSARGEPYPVTLSVTDSATPPFTVERVVDFFVYERLDVSPPDFHAAIEGASYTSDSHTVEYGTSPFRFEIDNLPIGLAIEQTTPTAFRLIGVPEVRTASNSAYHLVLNVTDSSIPAQQMSVDFDFFVRGRLRTLTAALPAGVEGWAYSPIVLQATGGLRPYTWQAANLPAGLVLQQDEASLEWTLTGTPTVGTNGVHALRLSVSDSDPDGFQTATTLVALSIAAGDDETPPLSLATTFLPRGTVGEDYPSTSIVATGGDGTYIWSVRGLPPGLQHSISTNTILLSGTPETSGEFFVDVTLADGSGDAISTIYPLIVSESIAPPPQQLPPTVDSQIADVLAGAAAAGCSLAGNNISGIALLACFYLCCVARQLFLRRAQFIDTKL
ncbi:MAG: putative Ig domain-containing protein [Planctomycetes bacterium]|nr:putative Ig domain-containing protein [Planctomycetota bacterium]